MHVLLGTAGSGKSTLVRSIILDTAKNHKVFLWLSEESSEDFYLYMNNYDIPDGTLENIRIFSEIDSNIDCKNGYEFILSEIKKEIYAEPGSVVFLDNLTTSRLFLDMKPGMQSMLVSKIKEIAIERSVPVFVVAHTRADFYDNTYRFMNEADVRGTKTTTNLCEYLYLYQRFHVANTFFPLLRVAKSRKHQITKTAYYLGYDFEKKIYSWDSPKDFEEIKQALKEVNRL